MPIPVSGRQKGEKRKEKWIFRRFHLPDEYRWQSLTYAFLRKLIFQDGYYSLIGRAARKERIKRTI